MAYDEDLADRVRVAVQHVDGVSEQTMFGGHAFLVGGHMAVAASGHGGLLVRCRPDETSSLVREPEVGRFEMRGREMDGWLRVDATAVATDDALAEWVAVGVGHASSLPPK
jgi:hypothetical protein